ncbi:MAG: hypothetical protein IJ302_03795 [Clostridia bacterium]|nr:hypothetical protein [Clostridia bacterium]
MRSRIIRCIFTVILSVLLAGWSLSLPPPGADTLLSVFSGVFTCAFTARDSTGEHAVILCRDAAGDTFTVRGQSGNAVLVYTGGSWYLTARGSETEAPLSIPVPLCQSSGAAAWRQLFSQLPDETCRVTRCAEGLLVTDTDGAFSAVFSEDGIPLRLSDGTASAEITSFTITPAQ